MDLPLESLPCLSSEQAEKIEAAFGIVMIREFANHKIVQAIAALNLLAAETEIVGEQAVATEAQLDQSLAVTFPASDPISIDSGITTIDDTK